jgi:2-polyprenyl-3-methyl-5-hydroxy-6-metoxy-1,4-benzoquinol methylase
MATPSTVDLPPTKREVVIHTPNLDRLRDFYAYVLEAHHEPRELIGAAIPATVRLTAPHIDVTLVPVPVLRRRRRVVLDLADEVALTRRRPRRARHPWRALMTNTHPYLLSNAAAQAETRFAALSSLFDETTFRHLGIAGIGSGWRCWEVGAGGPSVAAWMAEQVGSDGYVVATDIDTTWIDGTAAGFDVRVHDVAADDAPEGGGFDLIHARLVLVHVPDRERALRNLVGALKPGGWLVLEDFDTKLLDACLQPANEHEHRANKLRQGFLQLLGGRGVDLEYGRKLPDVLRAHGLIDIVSDAYFPIVHPAARTLEHANTLQVAAGLVAGGLATEQEIAEHLAALDSGEVDIAMPPLVSAWGRKAVG